MRTEISITNSTTRHFNPHGNTVERPDRYNRGAMLHPHPQLAQPSVVLALPPKEMRFLSFKRGLGSSNKLFFFFYSYEVHFKGEIVLPVYGRQIIPQGGFVQSNEKQLYLPTPILLFPTALHNKPPLHTPLNPLHFLKKVIRFQIPKTSFIPSLSSLFSLSPLNPKRPFLFENWFNFPLSF